MTATFLRKGAPCAPLDVTASDALILLEALSDHEQALDAKGCIRDAIHTRQLLRRVQDTARVLTAKAAP